MRIRQLKFHCGIVLIELLIVLCILTIVSTCTYFGLNQFYDIANSKIVQQQLLQALQTAQQEAIVRHAAISFCASDNQTSCHGQWSDGQIVFVNADQDGVLREKQNIIAIFNLASAKRGKLYWRSFPVYRHYLLFLPTLFSADNGMFWFCPDKNGKPAWAIALAKTGRARIIYPNKNGDITDSHGKFLQCEKT